MLQRSPPILPALDRRPTVLCFSHLRWNFVYQRPQHLLSRAARSWQVTVIEEPVWGAETRQARTSSGVTVIAPGARRGAEPEAILDLQHNIVDRLVAGASGPIVGWYYTPAAMDFTRHVDFDAVVYDNMDELSAFLGASDRLLPLEEELFARADVVFTGGRSLYEAKKSRHGNVHCFPSSIDTLHFGKARAPQPDPADQRGIPYPRIGFFGVIDERLDRDYLTGVSSRHPQWQFVMLGPVVKIDPESLPQARNIHWLGPKTYADLPAYLHSWDLGFMPFAINEATRFISPTKTPEFLAAGVPVVSTPIVDVVRPYGRSGLVEIAADPSEFSEAAARLLSIDKRPWLQKVDRHLAGNSWDLTWQAMKACILKCLPSPTRASHTESLSHV